MNTFTLFLFSILSTQYGFQVQKTFETPDLEDYFLQNPMSFDLDASGNLYIVDGEAKVIFKWGPDGKFIQTIGKPGQGPGEFSFSGRGPAMGQVYVIGDELFVFDGVQRKVSVFSQDGTFKRSPNLNLPRSRTMNFVVISENEYLILFRRFNEDKFMVSLKIIDSNGKVLKVLKEMEDDAVSFSMNNGRRASVSFKRYNPVLVLGYNAMTHKTYMGFSGETMLDVISKDGQKKRMELALLNRDVTQKDKDESAEASANVQRRRPVKFSFPEKMPYYSRIFPIENDEFIVFNESLFTHQIEGVLFTGAGEVKGKVDSVIGEGGGLLNARGKLLRFSLNEEDEFEFSLVEIKEK